MMLVDAPYRATSPAQYLLLMRPASRRIAHALFGHCPPSSAHIRLYRKPAAPIDKINSTFSCDIAYSDSPAASRASRHVRKVRTVMT